MRKGQGELTYKQLRDAYERLRRENNKLRNELRGRAAEMAMLYGTLDEIIDLCDDIPAGAEPPEKEAHNG